MDPSSTAAPSIGSDAVDTTVDFSKMKKKPRKPKPVAKIAEDTSNTDDAAPTSGAEKPDTTATNKDAAPLAEEPGASAAPTPAGGAGPALANGEDILVFREEDATGDDVDVEETWLTSDRDYTYTELLDRVMGILRKNNPALAGGRKRYTMVPPQVAREGSKKTSFGNIADICNRMRRSMEHAIQFLYTELGTSGSVDAAQRLIIKGRFQQKQIENVLRRYIVEYVTCKTCKSPDTLLEKKDRLYFMQCSSCGSRRSVSAIKTGFRAQTGSRRAAKAKAA